MEIKLVGVIDICEKGCGLIKILKIKIRQLNSIIVRLI